MTIALLATVARADQPAPGMTTEQLATLQKFQAIAKVLHPQFGDVPLAGANATLHLGHDYYFLPQDQARRVLVDAWRNPPDAADKILGMIFPAGKNFADDTWAAVISYSADGYIADDDAKEVDYNAMLQTARDRENDENAHRKSLGLDSLHLVGWAQPPYYDAKHHSLIWAREIQFSGQTEHGLNYDLRALGRGGVLSMNIISSMSKLDEVRAAAVRLQNIGTFDAGARYRDYNPSVDKKAAYGIGGLVAAGLGVIVAKKLGFLAIGLLFVKKFFAIIAAGVAGGLAWLRRLFNGRAKAPPQQPMA